MENGSGTTKRKTKYGMVGDLKQLLQVLRENGVQTFENDGLKVQFNERAYYAEPIYSYEEAPEFDKKIKELSEMSDEEILFYSAGARG